MKKVLFIQSQTLYLKSILPIAYELYKLNYSLNFKINKFFNINNNYKTNLKKISYKPTNANIINIEIFNFISKIINFNFDWNKINKEINFIFFTKLYKFDLVIGTTKDIPLLMKYKKFSKICCLGYQHIPFTLFLGLEKKLKISNNKLLEKNHFTNYHSFSKLLSNFEVIDSSFTYIDYLDNYNFNNQKKNFVLIFHPGGYRNIITKKNESKNNSYSKQNEFLTKICKPLLLNDLVPVIKIHPLCAQYHDYDDLKYLITNQNSLYNKIHLIRRDDTYVNYAKSSRFILTFGSSSLYELWSIGIKNAYVCNFLGEERSQKFSFFKSIFLEKYEDYLKLISNSDSEETKKDTFTNDIINAYSDLNKKNSVKNFLYHLLNI